MTKLAPNTAPPGLSWSRKGRLLVAILVLALLVALPMISFVVLWENLPDWLNYIVFGVAVLYCSFLIESDSVGIFQRPK
jgi:hypothetical protein